MSVGEADDRAVFIEVFGGGGSRMTYMTDIAHAVEEDILPTLTRFGIVKIERALFGIKIVLHNCLVLSKCQIFLNCIRKIKLKIKKYEPT